MKNNCTPAIVDYHPVSGTKYGENSESLLHFLLFENVAKVFR